MLRGNIVINKECIIGKQKRSMIRLYAYAAIIESVLAWAVAGSILGCKWKVKSALFEYDTLARIAYLYDLEVCDVVQLQEQKFTELMLSNNTRGFDVVPIKRVDPAVEHITRSSAGMRQHVWISVGFHIVWTIISLLILMTVYGPIATRGWKRFLLRVFFYSYVSVCVFDALMAFTYIAHIRQSLTMGMVIRHSGWKDIKVKNYDDFAGWLPVAACIFWLRGIFIFAFNIYGCSQLNHMLHSISINEVSQTLTSYGNFPIPEALQEYKTDEPITLTKLLYLYDPEACGRVYFYNLTTRISRTRHATTVIWIEKNNIAARFRTKATLWLILHLFWMLLAVINMAQSSRTLGFYTALLPFTMLGVALLITDLVHAGMFLRDARFTSSEGEIFNYINKTGGLIKQMRFLPNLDPPNWVEKTFAEDTSWIALMFAYSSCRGVVQFVVNFWIVKDNFVAGLAVFRSTPARRNGRRKSPFV